MSSYALTTEQEAEVSALIATHSASIAEKIARAVNGSAQHGRGASVSMSIKVGFNKRNPDLIELKIQEKIKHPKSITADQTSWTEPCVEMAFDTSETQGQQRLPGT